MANTQVNPFTGPETSQAQPEPQPEQQSQLQPQAEALTLTDQFGGTTQAQVSEFGAVGNPFDVQLIGSAGNEANTETARLLLERGGLGKADERRLQQIIAAEEAGQRVRRRQKVALGARTSEARKANEKATIQQWNLLAKWGASGTASQQEFNQAVESYKQQNSFMNELPDPLLLGRVQNEEDNPVLKQVDAVEAMASQFNVSRAYVNSLVERDPKTGTLNTRDVAKILHEQTQPSTRQMSAVKNQLKFVGDELKQMRKSTVLFNDDGEMRERPTAGFLSSVGLASNAEEEIDAFDSALVQFNTLIQEQQVLRQQQSGFTTPQRGASAGTFQPRAPQRTTPARGASQTRERGFATSLDTPYEISEGESIEATIKNAIQFAKDSGRPVFMKDPASDRIMEIRP